MQQLPPPGEDPEFAQANAVLLPEQVVRRRHDEDRGHAVDRCPHGDEEHRAGGNDVGHGVEHDAAQPRLLAQPYVGPGGDHSGDDQAAPEPCVTCAPCGPRRRDLGHAQTGERAGREQCAGERDEEDAEADQPERGEELLELPDL